MADKAHGTEREQIYTPDPRERQFSWRSVLTGCFCGALVGAINIPYGLKSGWGLGGSVLCAILSYTVWRVLHGVASVRQLSVLETNIAQTAGSAATATTLAAGFLGPIPALHMMGVTLSYWQMVAWTAAVAFLGIFFAVPLRKQMLLVDKLRFPSGLATAETIVSMFANGAQAVKQAKVLVIAAVVAFLWGVCVYLQPGVFGASPTAWLLSGTVLSALAAWGLVFTVTPYMFAGGLIIGPRVCTWMLLGGVLMYGVVGPWGLRSKQIEREGVVYERVDAAEGAASAQRRDFLSRWFVAGESWARTVSGSVAWVPLVEGAAGSIVAPSGPGGGSQAEAGKPKGSWSLTPSDGGQVVKLTGKGWQVVDGAHAGESVSGLFDAQNPSTYAGSWTVREAFHPYSTVQLWILIPAVATLVFESLTHMCFGWRSFLRAFSFAGRRKGVREEDASGRIPASWWVLGLCAGTVLTAVVLRSVFHVPVWMSVLAVVFSSVLAIIATRAVGETDINPIGAMGKVTQASFAGFGRDASGAVLDSQQFLTNNLMCAAVTGAGASQAADMMQDLKTGHLLGAKPRMQFFAQCIGIVFSLLLAPLVYMVFANKPEGSGIGSAELPAPGALAWRGMAEVMEAGLGGLPAVTQTYTLIGACVGVCFAVLQRVLPARYGWMAPSGMGLGIAMVVPPVYSIGFFVGAMALALWKAFSPKSCAVYALMIASGIIVGTGLTDVLGAAIDVVWDLYKSRLCAL